MVKIITDSSTLYSPEEGKKLGFDVMPLCVSIADLEDRDLLVDMDVFYGKIAEGNHPRSSQPPVGEVMEIYESYPEDDIINIAMADGLSGTYQSACGARESVDNKENIVVFNSFTIDGETAVADYKDAKINVTAYAIQAEGFENTAKADIWAKF